MTVALEIAIGLIFLYLLLSLVVLAINEGIATLTNFRAHTLIGGLRSIVGGRAQQKLDDATAFLEKLYEQPLVAALHERRILPFLRSKRPSYIPPRTFVLALINQMREDAKKHEDATKHPENVAIPLDPLGSTFDLTRTIELACIPEVLEGQLALVVEEARGNIDDAKLGLERWYNDAMERVSASYKARIQLVGLIVALGVTFATNADTIRIARSLAADPVLRAAAVTQAEQFVRSPPPEWTRAIESARDSAIVRGDPAALDSSAFHNDSLLTRARGALQSFAALGIPLGHPTPPRGAGVWARTSFYVGSVWSGITGLLITALAVSLGAPFWFDMLNKVVNIRAAGRAPEEKPKNPEARPTARGA